MHFLYLSVLCAWLNMFGYSSNEEFVKKGSFEVVLQNYHPENNLYKKKILLIIPPTGGMNFIDQSYARKFARRGINTKILRNWSNDDEYSIEFDIHNRFYTRAQNAIDLILQKYSEHEVWILGTSVGGLHGTIATARHKQITKALFIVSGADISSIISNSDQEVLVEAKKIRFEKFNIKNENQYLQKLRKAIPYEVQKLSIPRNKKIGLVISTNDKTVPTSNQILLENYWQTQRVSTLSLGHTPSVVFTWFFNSRKIKNFFLK